VSPPENGKPQSALVGEILADAERQAERLERRAKKDAKALVAKAKEDAEAEGQVKVEAAKAEAARRRERVLASVPVEMRRMRAEKIEAALDAIRETVREQLASRQGFDYGELLRSLALEAVNRMEGDAFVVSLNEADRARHGDALPELLRSKCDRGAVRAEIADTPAAIEGGVIVRDTEGRQVWSNSLSNRLDRMWPALRSEVAAVAGLLEASEAEESSP
jgi:vacuolar-type H+-ATPase subunit E/Vma4